jgi:hypothetical protein
MPKIAICWASLGLICAFTVGAMTPASAASSGCGDRHAPATAACVNSDSTPTQELAAQTRRPRVTIYRRRVSLPPNAVRQCRSWLVREYRVSGPVIVPQMYCWWEY